MGISFQKLSLAINCDFTQISEDFVKQLKNLLPLGNVDDFSALPQTEAGKALAAEAKKLYDGRTPLSKEWATLVKKATAIAEQQNQTLEQYYLQQLYKELSETPLGKEIAELQTKFKKYNSDVEAINARIKTVLANNTAYQQLIGGDGGLNDITAQLFTVNERRGNDAEAYVYTSTQDLYDAAKAAVEAYREAIEAAYADRDTATEAIEFDGKELKDAAIKAIAELSTAVDKAIADQAAYDKFQKVSAGLLSTYSKALKDIKALKSVSGETVEGKKYTAVEDSAAVVDAKLTVMYNLAVEQFNIKQDAIEGAADGLVSDESTADKAVRAINFEVEQFTELVEAQNALMTAELEKIASWYALIGPASSLEDNRTTIADVLAKLNDGENKTALLKQLDAVIAKIDELKAALDKSYSVLDVKEGQFDEQNTEITDELTKIKALIDPIAELQEYLDATVAKLKDKKYNVKVSITPEGDEKFEEIFSIYDKYETTIGFIQSAIDALEPQVVEDNEVILAFEDVRDEISSLLVNADKLLEWFTATNGKIGAFAELNTNLNTRIDEKLIVESADFSVENFKKTNDNYKEFEADYAKNREAFVAALTTTNDQACWEAFKALNSDIDFNRDYSGKMEMAWSEFEQDGTTANFNAVKAYIEFVETQVIPMGGTNGNIEYTGEDGLVETLGTIKADTNDENTKFENLGEPLEFAQEFINDYINFDNFCKRQLESLANIKTLAAEYQSAYQIYLDINEALQSLNAELDEIGTTFIPSKAGEEAQEHWQEVLAGYKKDSEAFNKKLEDARDAVLDKSKNLNNEEVQSALQEAFDAIKGNPAQLKLDIVNNEVNNGKLATESSRVRNNINSTIKLIEQTRFDLGIKGALTDELAELIETSLTELNNLLVRDSETLDALATVDGNVADSYAVGGLAVETKFNEFLNDYKAIGDRVSEIAQNFNADLEEGITSYNQGLYKNWQSLLGHASTAYTFAVREYNKYMYGLNWTAYMDYVSANGQTIMQLIKNHAGIYDLNQNIDAYTADLLKFYNEAQGVVESGEKKAAVAITNDANQNAINGINALTESIYNALLSMQEEVAAAAQVFYAEYKAQTETYINGEVEAMTAAGVTAENAAAATKANTEALKNFEKGYNTYFEAFEAAQALETVQAKAQAITFGLDIDKLEDAYTDANAAIDKDAVADAQWKPELQDAKDRVADLLVALDTDERYADATPGFKAEQTEIIDAAVEKLNELSDTATLETLAGLEESLNDILKSLTDAAAAIEKNSQEQVEETAQRLAFEADLEDMTSDYDALVKFVESLAGAGEDVLIAPKQALDAFEAEITGHPGQLVELKSQIEALGEAFKTALADAYAKAARHENNMLMSWEEPLKVAYNNAKVNSETITAEQLKAAEEFIDALPGTLLPVWNAEKPAEYLDAALKLENEISTLYQELCTSWDKQGDITNPNLDPVKAAMETVTDAQKNTVEAVNAYEEFLNGWGEDLTAPDAAFATALEGFKAEMAELDSKLGGEGDRIILTASEFVADYEALTEAINTKLEKLKAAKQAAEDYKNKVEANNAKAAELYAEIDAYARQFEDLKELIAGYEDESVETALAQKLSNIANALTGARDAVAKAAAAEELKENTQLSEIYGYGFKNAIPGVEREAAKLHAENVAKNLDVVYGNVADQVAELNIVPSEKETITSALAEIAGEKAALLDKLAGKTETAPSTFEDFEAITNEAKALIDRLNTLLDTAKENTFVLGDVNLEPDGVVNIMDVQLLINWVGEGLTLEDLKSDFGASVAAAADITGDGILDIRDVTAEINLVLGLDSAEPVIVSRRINRAAGNIGLSAIATENGVTRYAVLVDAQQAFVGGQIDLQLPEGAELVGAQLAGSDHELYRFDNASGSRLLIASLSNAEITMDGATLLYIDVEGGAPVVEGAIFTDSKAAGYVLGSTGTSGIENIDAENGGMIQRVYNAAGQAMRSLQRGINIIRHSDGSVTKEYRK